MSIVRIGEGMTVTCCRWFVVASIISALLPEAVQAQSANPGAVVTFDKVQAVLKKRCTTCHGGSEPRSGLDLTTLSGLKTGSQTGPVVVAGKPEQSLLYTLSAHLEEPKMPPGKPRMAESELKVFHDWIAGGLLERTGSAGTGSAVADVTPLSRPTAITAMAIDPRGETMALSGVQQVVLVDARTHEPRQAIPFPEGEIFALRFSKDGAWLVAGGGTGGESGKVVVFDAKTGQRLIETPADRDSVLGVDLSEDRRFLAWGGPWRTVKVMNVQTRELMFTLDGPTDWVLAVGFSPDGRLVAGSDRFGGLRVWSMLDGKEFWNLRGHTGAVSEVVWSPNSDHLLSVGEDGTARLWDLHTGLEAASWPLKIGGIWAADWHPSSVIAVAGRQKKGFLLDVKGEVLRDLALNDEPTEIEFAPDGSQVFVADANGRVTSFSIPDGRQTASFTLPAAKNATRIEIPWAARTRPVRNVSTALVKTAAAASDPLLQAVLDAEAAVKSTEESLEKLRTSAGRLRKSLEQRDAGKR
jgi:hypothetical protein